MTAKTRAIPSLHRDSFLPKVSGLCPDAASGNTTSLYCRPLCLSVNDLQDSFFLDNDRLSITLQTIFIFDFLDQFVIDEKISIAYLDKKRL